MAVNSILPPYPSFFDADGVPLEAGMIYVGQPGLEAQSSPKASFFDEALTIPTGTDTGAAVLTQAGFPVRNGSAVMIYCDGDFSITVRDKNGVLVYSALNQTLAFDTGSAANVPIQAPDGNFAVTGFGFINEPNTGLVRGGPGLVQHVVDGNVIFQVSETDVEFLMPPTGAAFVTGVFNATDPDLRQIATLVAEPGDLIYRSAVAWARRPKGDPGQIIRQNDTLAVPDWSDAIILRTVQSTASGTVFPFPTIPSWARRVTVLLAGVSLSGSDTFIIQLGIAAGYIAAGYEGGSFISTGGGGGYFGNSSGFTMGTNSAGEGHHGHMTIERLGATNTWVSSHALGSSARVATGGGSIALADTLTQVRLTRSGADTFDAGSVTISYE